MLFKWLKSFLGWAEPKENIDPKMKYLIVGLGNIGSEYIATRHNIGFEAIDHFAQKHDGTHKSERYGEMCKVKYKGRQLILLKPNTFMNLSGKAVKYWLEKEKIQTKNLLVIVDDLNLDLAILRLRGKGAAGGHNGLQDIQDRIGGSKYPRLRVGIGSSFNKGDQVNFVLGKWKPEELKKMPDLLERTTTCIESFVFRGMTNSMNEFNG